MVHKEIKRSDELKKLVRVTKSANKIGQLVFLEGLPGSGKSTIIDQLVKELQSKDHNRMGSIVIKISEFDINYEHFLLIKLHDEIIKRKLSSRFSRFEKTTTVNYLSQASDRLLGKEGLIPPRQILENLIKDFADWSKGRDTLLVVFDDYHKARGKILDAMIREIAKNVPKNVILLIASRSKLHSQFMVENVEKNVIEVPFFSFSQTLKYVKNNLKVHPAQAQAFAQKIYRKVKGHPWSVAKIVSIAKSQKVSMTEILNQIPKKGWHRVLGYISKETLGSLEDDERALLNSCFILPYLDHETCSYMSGIQDATIVLDRLEEKRIIVNNNGTFDLEDLAKEYLNSVILGKKQLFQKASSFFVGKAIGSKQKGMFQDSAKYGLYACELLISAENHRELVRFLSETSDIFLWVGFFKEVEPYLSKAMSACESMEQKAILLRHEADVHRMLAQYDKALLEYGEAMEIAEQMQDLNGKAWCLRGIAATMAMQDQYLHALNKYEEALSAFKNVPSIQGEALCLWGMARTQRSLSRYREALEIYEKAIKVSEQIGEEGLHLKQLVIWGLAEVHRAIDDYDKALLEYGEAMEIAEQMQDLNGKAWCLRGIAECQGAIGAYKSSLVELRKARNIFKITGERHAKAWTLWSFGENYRMLGEFDKALAYHEKAEVEADISKAYRCKGWAYRGIGTVHRMQGDSKAFQELEKAKQISEEIGDIKGTVGALLGLAEIWRMKRMYQDSENVFSQAKSLAESLGLKREVAHALLGIAETHRLKGSPSVQKYEEILSLYKKINVSWGVIHSLIGRAIANFKLGKIEEAKKDLADAEVISIRFELDHERLFIKKLEQSKNGNESHPLNFPVR